MDQKEQTPMKLPADIQLLNVRQVADALGLRYNGTYNLINARRIKSVKIGTRRLFTVKAVQEYIASLEGACETQGQR